MFKRVIVAAVLAAVFAGGMIFTMIPRGSTLGEGDFTVLAIKEEAVNDYNSMPVFKSLNEAAGISVNWTHATSNEYANSKSSRLTSTEIDAIYHAGMTNLELYENGKRGNLVAIDKYRKVMPNFSKILSDRPDIDQALRSPDGHIYSLPRVEEMGLKQYPNILFLNKTWVEQIRNSLSFKRDLPRNLEDGLKLTRNQFKEILIKFRDGDMNGNGDAGDEIPLSFVHNNWQGNESDLLASFGIPENRDHKTIVNDKIVFTLEDERWYEGIKELSEWKRGGLIDNSAFDSSQGQNSFLAKGKDTSKGVPRYGAFYWWEKETVVSPKRYDEYIIVEPLIDDNTGKQYVGVSNELEIEKGECVILNSNKTDKLELLKYFDKFFEPDYSAQLNYGSIGVAFKTRKEGGKLVPKELPEGQNADDFRMRNAAYGVVYLTQNEWENDVTMESRAQLRLSILNTYVKKYTYAEDGAVIKPIPNLNYTEEEIKALNVHESTFSDAVEGKILEWVNNGVSYSDWSNFVNSTVKSSLQQIKKINQDGYNRLLKASGNKK